MSTTISRENNFNLIRIIAALQVVFTHTLLHLDIRGNWLEYIGEKFILYFPGVPIFFTVSGFLIYWSYENAKGNNKKYFINRFLRLYPALWICLLVLIGLIINDYPGSALSLITSKMFLLWIFLQASFFQFYTPDLLRFWGVHTPNGSLWTIIVEIQFYLFVPLFYYLLSKLKKLKDALFILFFLVCVVLNFYVGSLDQENTLTKLITVSVFPYLYFFLTGVFAYKYWDYIRKIVEGKFLIWFTIYVVYILFFGNYLGYSLKAYLIENPFNFVTSLLLSLLTLSAAFTKIDLSEKILKGNDISYGVYIYHMLVVNFFVQREWIGSNIYFFEVFIIVLTLAWLSWHFIEKRALLLKNRF